MDDMLEELKTLGWINASVDDFDEDDIRNADILKKLKTYGYNYDSVNDFNLDVQTAACILNLKKSGCDDRSIDEMVRYRRWEFLLDMFWKQHDEISIGLEKNSKYCNITTDKNIMTQQFKKLVKNKDTVILLIDKKKLCECKIINKSKTKWNITVLNENDEYINQTLLRASFFDDNGVRKIVDDDTTYISNTAEMKELISDSLEHVKYLKILKEEYGHNTYKEYDIDRITQMCYKTTKYKS